MHHNSTIRLPADVLNVFHSIPCSAHATNNNNMHMNELLSTKIFVFPVQSGLDKTSFVQSFFVPLFTTLFTGQNVNVTQTRTQAYRAETDILCCQSPVNDSLQAGKGREEGHMGAGSETD